MPSDASDGAPDALETINSQKPRSAIVRWKSQAMLAGDAEQHGGDWTDYVVQI